MIIAISGAGVGGLTAAIALAGRGVECVLHEQAAKYTRVGADINLTPNAVRALDGLGIGGRLRETAARPVARLSRAWDTGEVTSRLPMSDEAERRYGAPQLTLHRADLMSALEDAAPLGSVRFARRVTGASGRDGGACLELADGTVTQADAVIGADGIHSAVRTAILGMEKPRFTGMVAYRAVIPTSRVDVPNLDAFTKWWGPDPQTQLVTFPLNRGRDLFVFATTAVQDWLHESWTMPGSVEEFHAFYAGFHPEARKIVEACDEVMKSALYERDPLPTWSQGHVSLLGDACHPMMPFMAQGAAMAIEDAVVLSRCLGMAREGELPEALLRYQAARMERTSRIQLASRGNEWLKEGGNADWVYGYPAWSVPV